MKAKMHESLVMARSVRKTLESYDAMILTDEECKPKAITESFVHLFNYMQSP